MPLVIVDMQPSFKPAMFRPVIEAVKSEIVRAKNEERPIIVLEYGSHPETLVEITALLTGPAAYKHLEVRRKSRWSGADVVVDVCRERGWQMPAISICGVETECCVRDTVVELLDLVPEANIEVLTEACNGNIFGFGCMPTHRRVQLVSRSTAA